ncbi:3-phosphoserine/phosphohydroxythreonine transaminase [Weeksellaceae bacterium TAE3-ERU29]|nr:3-phosphoserine/phosphohydroxythreonine transaminase [Weeksellaceae bacterium TAE3-ERU29]
MKMHNFCAGPCILPQSVFEKASQAVKDFDSSGLSILEISHRSNVFQQILKETRDLIKELTGLNNDYEVLLLQGGASLQFTMVPFNLAKNDESPLYLDTGRWANNAFLEAEKICKPLIVASSKDKNYNYIPKDYEISENASYFHCTSNNTIYGTQMKSFPKTKVPLISDMSSDILSRKLDYSQFDLIYAGAQKNIGAAGVTVVIVRKEILEKNLERNIPSYLDYRVQIAKDSCFNTSPVFSIYTAYLNLLWLKEQGGIEAMDKRNKKKAETLYAEIDKNDLFEGVAVKEDRSDMNVTFTLKEVSLKEKFAEICEEAGVVALKGHRTVGGYRASLYNALELESVEVLVGCMKRLNEIA